jgi:hypothetical protein
MAQANSQTQYVFLTKESVTDTIVACANANACRITKCNLTPAYPLIARRDKAPGFGAIVGVPGAKSAAFDITMDLCPSGAAGTVPDCDPLLDSLFGAAATLVASTSATYNLATALRTIDVWNYGFAGTKQVALGSIVNTAKFNLGLGLSSIDFSGISLWVLDSDQFATADTKVKGVLASFPALPSVPVYNGTPITSFVGTATLNSQTYLTIRDAVVTYNMNRQRPSNVMFNGAYPGLPVGGVREITIEFSLSDDDSANLAALKVTAFAKTPIAISLLIGGTAGSRCTINLANVVLDPAQFDDSQPMWGARFKGRAFASSSTALDESTIAWT